MDIRQTIGIICLLGITTALPAAAQSDRRPNPFYCVTMPLSSGLSAKAKLAKRAEWRDWTNNLTNALFSKVFDDCRDLKLQTDLTSEIHIRYTVAGDGMISDVQSFKGSLDQALNETVVQAVKSLNGNEVLKFPDGFEKTPVVLQLVIQVSHGQIQREGYRESCIGGVR